MEARLAEEIRQVERTREEIRRLQQELAAMPPPEEAVAASPGPAPPSGKVALFRSFFRGREDVYQLI